MTTLIIKSDSDEKTDSIIRLAEELGLIVKQDKFEELTIDAMVKGIGRKATDEELIDYLSKGIHDEPLDIEQAFAKYSK